MPAAIVEGPIDVNAALAAVSAPARGAVVLFLGAVRDSSAARAVVGIDYHAYRPMAERVLAGIVADLEREHAGLAAAIVHRVGALAAGEISVAIATASPRREAAYAASRRALERLKHEAPIWKRERYADGSTAWREEEALAPSDGA